ncbi:MAG: DMT family transporter [Planctomycetes bacterium]|nr:DMT family transporter [Planctomycetota bacterium]
MERTPEQQAKRTRRIATAALMSVCLFWGATFLWMEQGTDALQHIYGDDNHAAIGAFFLLWRFVIAALLMPLLVPRSVKRLDRAAWKWGFWLSIPFALGFLLQIFGLAQADVPPSQSAFLTSLYVVATPILAAIVWRRLPARGVALGVVLAVIGAAYMKGPPQGGLSLGAWSTIACAVVFGAHILLTDYATKRADPMAITLVMFLCSIGWNGLALLAAPSGPAMFEPGLIARAFTDLTFLGTEVACAVFATVIAVSVLNRWQKELAPARAAIVYTAEPVLAAIISIVAGRDTVSCWLAFGATMILLANLSAEFLRKRPKLPAPGV